MADEKKNIHKTIKMVIMSILSVLLVILIILSLQEDESKLSESEIQQYFVEASAKTGEAIEEFKVHADVRYGGKVFVSLKVKFNVRHTLLYWGVPITIPTGHIIPIDGENFKQAKRDLEILEVKRNGQAMSYQTLVASPNVTRIFPADTRAHLAKGIHELEVLYKLENAIADLPLGYELNFPVVSSYLPVPVKKAEITLNLPKNINMEDIKQKGFLGAPKKRTGNPLGTLDEENKSLTFMSGRVLQPNEGMFVSVVLPK